MSTTPKRVNLDPETVERLERFRQESDSLGPAAEYGEIIERLCDYHSLDSFGDQHPDDET